MTFRRLTLVLALLTTPAQASDAEASTTSEKRSQVPASAALIPGSAGIDPGIGETIADGTYGIEDLLLRPDGAIAGAVPCGDGTDGRARSWVEVRFDGTEPTWVEIPCSRAPLARIGRGSPARAEVGPLLEWSALGGVAVTRANGECIGLVRGGLICPRSARVVALALCVGPLLVDGSRTIAVPWSMLRVHGAERGGRWTLGLRDEGDLGWMRLAPDVELGDAPARDPGARPAQARAEDAVEAGQDRERFSARLDGETAAPGLLGDEILVHPSSP